MSRLSIPVFAFAFLSCATAAPMTVHLLPSMPSPQPVGTAIGLVPHVDDAPPGMLVFRYSVSVDHGALHIVRDFSQQRDSVLRPARYGHDATVHVTVRKNGASDLAEADLPFKTV